jgi:hypothetical protein
LQSHSNAYAELDTGVIELELAYETMSKTNTDICGNPCAKKRKEKIKKDTLDRRHRQHGIRNSVRARFGDTPYCIYCIALRFNTCDAMGLSAIEEVGRSSIHYIPIA